MCTLIGEQEVEVERHKIFADYRAAALTTRGTRVAELQSNAAAEYKRRKEASYAAARS